MKIFLLLINLFFLGGACLARHGKGGSITYEYLGAGTFTGTSKYKIIVKHYIDCDGTQFIEPFSYVGIFDGGGSGIYKAITIPESGRVNIQKMSFDRCIHQPPVVCYVVVSYIAETDLPDNLAGYVLAEQECCRIQGIINIPNSSTYGITNTNTIPGVINGIVYRTNSSPVFAQKDTVVICKDSYFSLDFSAIDANYDVLKYAFSPGKSGGTTQTRQPNPPSPPPYPDLPYQSGFTALEPLGPGVKIDANTGIISGIAASTLGSYIIAVAVSEYRNGVLIGVSKKEVQVTVAECSLSAAILKPEYINCKDFSFHFENEFILTNVNSYLWDFGVTGIGSDTSTAVIGAYTYPDTGKYTLKLNVTSATGCEDSATANVLVYPVFKTGFKVTGSCIQSPFQFDDTSFAQYGKINKWLWDFGDAYSSSNESAVSNPSHIYSGKGSYTATLISTASTGCVDTASATVLVSDKPFLSLPFKDTLICSIDTLALHANGSGIFSWSPTTNLLNPATASPLVFPKTTTKYVVTLDEKGCVAKDSVIVNVLDSITVLLPADTTICQSDSILLQPVTQALQYQWSPDRGLNNAFIKTPKAAPQANTIYRLAARLGKCQASDSISIRVVPYPRVQASNDTTICFGTNAQLNAVITGTSFTWEPSGSLQNVTSLSPSATPLQTTAYVLSVYDVQGCPKPATDTIVVNVLPRINAFAGNDTSIIAGQPLQLNASGGTSYMWSPAIGLDNSSVGNPVANLDAYFQNFTYVVTVSKGACFATDSIHIKIFTTGPEIFVPSAFTPNGDGKNDVLKPILVGIKNLETFKVFTRWGQLVYSSNQAKQGWDGTINGAPQQTAAYVYVAVGLTYLDQKIMRKGTVLLIR
ncbi:MAG: cell surface protein [Ferruginibacter sp.]|nr:cell surface protein [Ferruginibacter sp.]